MNTSASNLHFQHYWYIACQSKQLKRSRPLFRCILDQWIVLFRDNDGLPHALSDRCIHRNFQLSKGCVKNGLIQCPYHGWTYDKDGVVHNIPAEGEDFKKLSSRKTQSFECKEIDDLIYIRLKSHPEIETNLFRMPAYKKKGFKTVRLFNIFKNNVTNCAENFVDVPHTVFVHDKIFRESRGDLVEAEVTRSDGVVKIDYLKETNNLGWFSWFLNPKGNEIKHTDYFHMPNITSVEYVFSPGKEFIITSQSVPVNEWETHVYTDLTFNFGFWNLFAGPIVKYQGQSVINQDLEVLENQSKIIQKFGESFQNSRADIVHVLIESIREAIKQGKDPKELPHKMHKFRFWI